MNDASFRRRRVAWRVLGLLLLIPTVLIGTSAFWIRTKAAAAWTSMESRLRAQEAAEPPEPVGRAVLLGDSVPGDAWEDYLQCVAEIQKLADWRRLHTMFPEQPGFKNPGQLRAMVESRPDILAHLRRGVRRTEAHFPNKTVPCAWGPGSAHIALADVQWLAWAEARRLAEAGRAREAAEMFLVLASLGVDLGRYPRSGTRPVGSRMISVALNGLQKLAEGMTAEDWGVLLPALERLDGALPGAESRLRAATRKRWEDVRLEIDEGRFTYSLSDCIVSSVYPWQSWRYGFSSRLMAAEAFELEQSRSSALIAGVDARRFSEILAQNAELREWAWGSRNVVLREVTPALRYYATLARGMVARVRLLRMAGRYAVSGSIEALPDPFGDRLRGEVRNGRLVLWSNGQDGADNQGFGDWKDEDRDKDLVLEVNATR